VIDNFVESCFNITPPVSFSLYRAPPRGVRFLTFIPDIVEYNRLASTQAAGSESASRPPDNLLVWQTKSIHGSASGVLARDLFRPSVH